jgi:hypothetical protein
MAEQGTNGTLTEAMQAAERLVVPAPPIPNASRVADGLVAGTTRGGRQTLDQPNTFITPGAFRAIRSPRDPRTEWDWARLDSRTFEKITPQRLLELLADLSPEASQGIWVWLRMCVNEWKLDAYRRNADGTRGDPYDDAKQRLTVLMDRLTDLHGAPEVVWSMAFLGVLLRGAFFFEVVLDAAGREAIDIVTPDPATARFQLQSDPVRGQFWQLGQWQGSKGFVELTSPLVRYVPIDPLPGDAPYGRPLLAPTAFVALFSLGLMHDLRRVISQQGYPRHNIKILLDQLREQMPAEVQDNPDKFFAWAETLQKRIQMLYEGLEPSDAFVHGDSVELEVLKGAAGDGSMAGIAGIIEWLERMLARSLKLMPMMLGVGGGRDQGDANRQYEIQAQGVKSLQQLAETNIERMLELVLQAQGIQADVELTFEENRVAEALRDQQVDTLVIENAYRRYAIDGNYKKLCETIGADPDPAMEEPLYQLAGIVGGSSGGTGNADTAQQVNPDEGSARAALMARIGQRLAKVQPAGRPLPALPLRALSEADAAAILDAWDEDMDRKHAGMLDAEVTDG